MTFVEHILHEISDERKKKLKKAGITALGVVGTLMGVHAIDKFRMNRKWHKPVAKFMKGK